MSLSVVFICHHPDNEYLPRVMLLSNMVFSTGEKVDSHPVGKSEVVLETSVSKSLGNR